ncbi:MAG TPA: deoxyribose-phosphate aldolase [Clostridiaceae bacterium]|nr:deoxyribose-phosphate aldolase [Clostridiaceae bacterium]
MEFNRKNITAIIDHTLLKAEATEKDILKCCEDAKKYGFASVCIHPCYVKLAAEALKGSPVKVATVIGFPLGANHFSVKAFEAAKAVEDGVNELDMVINIGALKQRRAEYVENDIRVVVEAAKSAIVKVILETCYLTKEEKILACELCKKAGAHFVKTSTGFASAGATVEDVALMRKIVGQDMGVKAAGGIRTLESLIAMVKAGANRIGTSSGIKIIEEIKEG